jgi:hypothetical protein
MTGRTMNDNERLQLQKMINANDTTDQTNLIRQIKHSVLIKHSTNLIHEILIGPQYANLTTDELKEECIKQCPEMHKLYTDIFNKLINREINLVLFNKFIMILEEIEDGVIDQHDGSFKIGNVLKEIYVDSAVVKADKINVKYDQEKQEIKNTETTKMGNTDISWAEYKKQKTNK